jgi:hypothetical protein
VAVATTAVNGWHTAKPKDGFPVVTTWGWRPGILLRRKCVACCFLGELHA